METLEAIAQRRSIRKFKDTPISDVNIVKILTAAIQAPSGKNRQPWRFIVVREDKRTAMIQIMRTAIERHKAQGRNPGSCGRTTLVMERAPVTIFVFNPYEKIVKLSGTPADVVMNVVDVQSVGAAIQNMHLAAQDLGIGALWICDVFYAYEELSNWLGETHQLIAAVTLGYPDEQPKARPRRSVDEVTTWFSGV